jgi:hypothetical protein
LSGDEEHLVKSQLVPTAFLHGPGAAPFLLAGLLLGPACLGCSSDASGEGSTAGTTPPTTEPPEEIAFEPPAPTLRRLLDRYYVASIRDLLGDEAAAAADPPADALALNGFDAVGAAQTTFVDDTVSDYELSAWAVASAAAADTARIDAWSGCEPEGPEDTACLRQFISGFGRVAWRRSLDDEEVDAYAAVGEAAATELGDFYAGVEYALSGLLQSPNFLYVIELGEPVADAPGQRALTGLELVTRLSFFLLGTTPSAADLDDAEAGALATEEGVRAKAQAMLDDPRAKAALDDFYAEVYSLRDLDTTNKDATIFPDYTPALAVDMKEETLRLIRDLVWDRDADIRELLTAQYSFVTPALAAHYGLDAPAGGGFARVDFPDGSARVGLLGQGSFLSVFAHENSTSPTRRGKFVRERVLCQSVPAPPGNVNTTLEPPEPGRTMREQLLQHQTDESCRGCHELMDNIGFGMESFDGVGAFRTKENGVTVDPSGEILGVGEFDDLRGLAALLHEQPAVADCAVRNFYRHALGHVETTGELELLGQLVDDFVADEHRVRELLVDIAASRAFRVVGELE